MDIAALRSLVSELNLDIYGVEAVVTRPAPADTTPVETTAIWQLLPKDDTNPTGVDFQRREPRRVLTIPRSAISSVPKGTEIVAKDKPGGTSYTWTVDQYDQTDPEWWRLLVKR